MDMNKRLINTIKKISLFYTKCTVPGPGLEIRTLAYKVDMSTITTLNHLALL